LKFDQSLMRKIPAAAPVVATFKFMPKLSQRAELYSFNHVYMGAYTLSTKSYALPETTRYALIDFSDEKMLACKNAQSQSHIKNFIENSPWQVLDFGMDTVLMIKGSKRDLSPLFEVNPSALNGPDKSFKAYTADRQIKFEGFSMRMGQGDHADQIGITFYWKALKKPTVNYDLLLTLVDSSGKTVYEYHHPIGYRIRPATDWQRSDRVAEHFWFCLPAGLPARPVEMRIGLGDTDKKQIVPFTGPLKGQLDPQGRARLDTLEPS
ncbi:MAG: hypothetical protein WCG06_07070, partial [Candidatus Omnitrophota bacterium]